MRIAAGSPQHTNREKRTGSLSDAMMGADVFIGVSGPNVVEEEHVKLMAKDSIIFALANPDPEIDPVIARRHAAIVATGRSDEPNQINNVLAFPGIFRGLLDVGRIQDHRRDRDRGGQRRSPGW